MRIKMTKLVLVYHVMNSKPSYIIKIIKYLKVIK